MLALGFALKEFLVDIQVPELSFRSTTFGGSNKDDCNFLFQVFSNLIKPKTFWYGILTTRLCWSVSLTIFNGWLIQSIFISEKMKLELSLIREILLYGLQALVSIPCLGTRINSRSFKIDRLSSYFSPFPYYAFLICGLDYYRWDP